MMDIRELRIGNYLNHFELGIVEVIAVGKDYIHCIFNGETFYENIRSFSHIPITEERLINAGFSKDFGKDIYNKEDITWHYWNPSSIIININNGFVNYNLEIECGYIHQLQNIVFDLTKKEIEFKV